MNIKVLVLKLIIGHTPNTEKSSKSESSYFSDASNSDFDSDLIISDASCSDDDEGYGNFIFSKTNGIKETGKTGKIFEKNYCISFCRITQN